MSQVMFSVEDVKKKIESNKTLFLAADENLLSALPKGNWIGGTIPYFMAENGGAFSQDKIYVTELPDYIQNPQIKVYDKASLKNIYMDIPANGVGLIVIPATSEAHVSFALDAPNYPDFATRPLIGWISGVFLDDLGKITPKVFDGSTSKKHENEAVVLYFNLPENKLADINIINIFEQGSGDIITFLEDGFSAKDVLINGNKANFADYIKENNLDVKYPLVADYSGAMVNISFQAVDEDKKEVLFYAPVFKGMEYKHAKAINNYVAEFNAQIPQSGTDTIVFSCNCILNYLYSELEGKETGGITGPITFGEVAYQLLNQTLVYLKIFNQ